MDIFKLVGSVFVDTESANESLSKTDSKASSVGTTLSKVGSTAAKVGTAVAVGAATAVTGVVELTKSTAANADEIDKASIRMGIGAEAYQEYAYAAELAGVDTSTLEQAAKKLEGTDINFDDAMDSIMSLGTAEERSAAAAELFGDKVAYNLSPMIEQSQEDFEAAKQEAEDLGLVMSQDDVTAGAAMNDTFTKIEDSMTALTNSLGTAVMPIVQEFADKVIEYMPQIQAMMDQLAPIIAQVFDELVPPLFELMDSIFPVLVDLINTLLPIVAQIIAEVLPIMVELIQELLPPIMDLVQELLPVILDLIVAILPILDPIIQLMRPILELFVALIEPMLSMIDYVLPPLIKILIWFIDVTLIPLQTALNEVAAVATAFAEAFVNGFKYAKETGKPIINSILQFLNSFTSGICSGINAMIRAFNSVHVNVPDWVTKLTGLKSFGFNMAEISIPQIPLLAKGGVVDGGAAIVGEDGPELLQSSGSKTKVTPLNDNNNDFVELCDKVDELISLFKSGMGVYIDGSALVGKLAPDINESLGGISSRQRRAFT